MPRNTAITPKDDPDIRLAAFVVFFNDAKSLQRCLSSVTDGVDAIVAIDGKFKHYPFKHSLSTDGSREVVRSFSNAYLYDRPDLYEHQKRQTYLEISKEHDVNVGLIIDSDEFAIAGSDWQLFRNNLQKIILDRDKGRFPCYDVLEQTWGSHGGDQFQRKPRVWYEPYDMRYIQGRHFVFRHKDPSRVNTVWEGSYGADLIEGIRLGHDHRLRSKQHMDGRFVYAKWLVDFEGKPEYL